MKYSLLFITLLAGILASCDYDPNKRGRALYTRYCANCHMENGEGLRGLIPPVADADFFRENQERLACIIRYGLEGEIVVNGKTYDQPMAGIPELAGADIANIINYINENGGYTEKFMSHEEVEDYLDICAKERKKQLKTDF